MSDRGPRETFEVLLLMGIVIVAARLGLKPPENAVASTPATRNSVIWVDDESSSRWPVRTSATAWSGRSDVTLRLGSCRSGQPCVQVSDANFSSPAGSPVYGQVKKGSSRVTIKLNNTPSTSAGQRRAIVCRQLGLALGVPSNSGEDSCMGPDPDGRRSPSASDVAAVNKRY